MVLSGLMGASLLVLCRTNWQQGLSWLKGAAILRMPEPSHRAAHPSPPSTAAAATTAPGTTAAPAAAAAEQGQVRRVVKLLRIGCGVVVR